MSDKASQFKVDKSDDQIYIQARHNYTKKTKNNYKMKEFNLQLIEEQVGTQYGDYSGYIQIDGHSGADLFKLCEDNGVNLENNFLLSFGMSESTINGIGQRNKIMCRALILENYGNSFDSVSKKIQSLNGKAKAKQYTFDIEYKDLTKYIKRFDFMVLTKISNYITDLKIEDEY